MLGRVHRQGCWLDAVASPLPCFCVQKNKRIHGEPLTPILVAQDEQKTASSHAAFTAEGTLLNSNMLAVSGCVFEVQAFRGRAGCMNSIHHLDEKNEFTDGP